MCVALLTLAACCFLYGAAWLWYSFSWYTPLALRSPHHRPMKVCVVLGSGGHTSEMLYAISILPTPYWQGNRPFYVVSETDRHSASLAIHQEQALFRRRAIVHTIPRAREVGQSYTSSVLTTMQAIFFSVRVVWHERPDTLLLNGPGVCIPIVVVSLLVACLAPWRCRRPAIVYLESFTCVHHLSLTAKILLPFLADIFAVHWRSLEDYVQRRPHRCQVVYMGCEDDQAEAAPLPAAPLPSSQKSSDMNLTATSYALVTVGSTKYPELIQAVLQPSFCQTLRSQHGIQRLSVQYGTGTVAFPPDLQIASMSPISAEGSSAAAAAPVSTVYCGTISGVEIEAFAYQPHLNRYIQNAALVITHAGAGTILEALQAQRLTVVVPNRALMSDHQLELAEALAAGHFLFSVQVAELEEKISQVNRECLRVHGGVNAERLRTALQTVLAGEVPSLPTSSSLSFFASAAKKKVF